VVGFFFVYNNEGVARAPTVVSDTLRTSLELERLYLDERLDCFPPNLLFSRDRHLKFHTRSVKFLYQSIPFRFSSLHPIPRPAPGVQRRMHSLARSRLARDVFLVFLGAVSMHFVTTLFHPFDDLNPTWTLQSYQEEILIDPPPYGERVNVNKHNNDNHVFGYGRGKGNKPSSTPASTAVTLVDVTKTIPETEMIQHAPGWTVFKNLYMSNGTFYVVSDKPRSEFPELSYILSIAIPALATPENVRARLPTDQQMDFIGAKDAQRRWGPVKPGEKNRIWPIAGSTVCFSLFLPVGIPSRPRSSRPPRFHPRGYPLFFLPLGCRAPRLLSLFFFFFFRRPRFEFRC